MTNILTREFTITEIIDFLKSHFANNRDAFMDLSLDETGIYELPEINAILADFNVELDEFKCELPDLNFISLAS